MRSILEKIPGSVVIPVLLILATASVYFLVLKPDKGPEVNTAGANSTTSGKKKKELNAKINVRRPEISHLVDGKVTWKVAANSIDTDTLTGVVKLAGSSGVFFRNGEKGDSTFEFEAPTTVYDSKKKTVRANGRISGKLLPENYSLEAYGMSWSEDNGTLTMGKVRIKTSVGNLRCGRLILKPKSKTMKLAGGVVAEMPVGGGAVKPRSK